MRPYTIAFTDAAQKRIIEQFDMERTLTYIRHELDVAVFEGADSSVGINDLVAHVMEMDPSDPEEGIWICTVAGPDRIEVDSGRYFPGPVVEVGPFAGRRLMVPKGDSEEP
jgi:hypothetical protein